MAKWGNATVTTKVLGKNLKDYTMKKEHAKSKATMKAHDKAMRESVRPKMEELLESLASEAAEVWEKVLAKEAKGLDFKDPDDRAIFRGNVLRVTKQAKLSMIKDLAKHYGAKKVDNSRQGALRSLANAYMGYKY
jgi:hypothetical protein